MMWIILTPVTDPGPRISLPQLSPRHHRTGDGGDTPNFGVLFMGYTADINFQNAVGTAYGGISGAARDTKVQELMAWYNASYRMTRCTGTSPALAVEGTTVSTLFPWSVRSTFVRWLLRTPSRPRNCPHTPQHVNVGFSMFGSPGPGSASDRSWQGTLGCGGGHPGSSS